MTSFGPKKGTTPVILPPPPTEPWDDPTEVLLDQAAEILLIKGMSTEAGLPIRREWLKRYGEMRGVYGFERYGEPDGPYLIDFVVNALHTVCKAQMERRFNGYPCTDRHLAEISNAATRYMERWTMIGRWKVTAQQYAANVPDHIMLDFERQ